MGEERVADAHVDSDCATKIARQQNRAENRGTRNQIDENTDDLEDSDVGSNGHGESEVRERLHDRSDRHHFYDAVEEQEQYN